MIRASRLVPLISILSIYTSTSLAQLENTRIVFGSDIGGTGELYVVDYVGGGITPLTDRDAPLDDHSPAWSADGTQIAFERNSGSSSWDVWAMPSDAFDVNGSTARNVSNTPGGNYQPSWSPDGSRMVFRSSRDGNDEIYAMDVVNGGAVTRLTSDPAVDRSPAFSPDGNRIVFASGRAGGPMGLYVMDAVDADADGNGDNLVPFTVPADDDDPVYSPDGAFIAFYSGRAGAFLDIWVMDAQDLDANGEGDNPRQLTNDSRRARAPSWSPDGSHIVFTTDTQLHTVRVADLVEVTLPIPGDALSDPAWSPVLAPWPILSVSPPSLDFATVAIGSSSDPQPFIITNTGAGTLTVSDVTTDNPAFTVTPTVFDVAPGLDQTVTVIFTPTVEGAEVGNITIADNASGNPTVVTATGTGTVAVTPPTIAVTAPTADEILPAGTTSTTLAVDILNHAAPGHWHWQLGTPFADSGTATGTEVPAGTFTDTIPNLVDGQTYTVYVALVDDATTGDALVDAITYPTSRASVTFSVAPTPTITIDAPTAGQVLAQGTTSTPLSVTIANHPESGQWAWQLDAAFPMSGPAGGTLVPSGNTATITPLADGEAHTVYVALVKDNGDVLDTPATDSVAFSVAGAQAIAITSPTTDQALPPGVTNFTLRVDITGHPAPGHWHWQLDTPFPASGAAGGTHVDAGTTTAGITGLVDGASHIVYVALVDGNHDVLATPVEDSAAFSVGTMPADYVQVESKQGAAGTPVVIPIWIYDVAADVLNDPVTAVDLDLLYDETILTPRSDAGGLATVATGAVVPAGWTLLQNVVSAGRLAVSLAVDGGAAGAPLPGGGALLEVTFDVSATAVEGIPTPVRIDALQLNEGSPTATGVDGLFTVLGVMYGDVTGNGAIAAFDASWVLRYVSSGLVGEPDLLPIETSAPVWAPFPLDRDAAAQVADVDTVDGVTSADASDILKKRVGIIDLFVAEGGAASPAPSASVVTFVLRASATSERPGARITVSLDTSAIEGLTAGEFALDFDPALLRLSGVALRTGGGDQPLQSQMQRDGRFAIAFASARPMEASPALLEVTFEASRAIHEPTESAIRATHLRLNRALVETDFVYPFRVEPYQNRLMANYPNPFNPETWIPFELAEDSDVTIRVYDLAGGRIRTLELGALATGEYVGRDRAAYWDGANAQGERVASGVYVYELAAGGYRSLRRMVVMK